MARPLRFGAHYSGVQSRADVTAYAQRLQSLGFDGFWVTDGARSRDPLIVLAMAGAVADLDLGTAVLLLPFRHPTLLARQVATLDNLSAGKVILGVGVGGERPADFDAYGVDRRERGPRANEVLRLLLRLWQESDVTHEGRFYQMRKATLDARTARKPHPPVWIGGRLGGQGKSRDAGLRRLARYGDGWLPYLVSPEQYASGLERLAAYAAERGRDAAGLTRGVQVYVGLHDTRENALDAAMQVTARAYGLSQEQVERYCALGTPEDVTARLKEYVDAGAEYFVIQWSCRSENVLANLAILSSEVLPALKGAELG